MNIWHGKELKKVISEDPEISVVLSIHNDLIFENSFDVSLSYFFVLISLLNANIIAPTSIKGKKIRLNF